MKPRLFSLTVVAGIGILILLETGGVLEPGGEGNYTIHLQKNGGDRVQITAELADNRTERRRGLMFRESLSKDHGMLFVFPRERKLTFWMKNTLIPLDIVFINSSRRIVDIDRAYPEPGVPEEELERYRSDSPARFAVELNQNFTRKNGIDEGDRVVFSKELESFLR